MKTKLNNQKGFTIIEVLIVLAIAGLILLIVLLAVPALQRNQRNTSRKSDVGRLGSSATEFVANQNGTLPAVGDADDTSKILDSAGSFGQFKGDTFLTIVAAAADPIDNVDNAQLAVEAKCAKDADGKIDGTTEAGTSRQMAVQYAVETSGEPDPLCVDL